MSDSSKLLRNAAVVAAPQVQEKAAVKERRIHRTAVIQAVGIYAILAFALAVSLFPFLWMIRTAFTPQTETFALDPGLLPDSWTWANIERVLTSPNIPFMTQFWNSVIVSTGTTLTVIVAGTWGAYALARFSFRGNQTFSLTLLLIQLFPGVLLIIPLFVVLSNLHLTNSLLGLVISYSTLQLPFAVWLLRGYFVSLPREVEDAARLDGSGYFGVLFRIVLPTAAPGIAAAATLAFISSWNEFLFAYVLINDADKRVLAVGLSAYIDQFTIDFPGLFAMATLTTVPVVLVFLFFQRYLVGGLASGAVKS